MSLLSIQHEYKDEYMALGEDEREELVREHKENIHRTKHLAHPSPRGLIQDFSNTVRNLIMLVGDVTTYINLWVRFIMFERSTPLGLVLALKDFFALCETHLHIRFNLSGSSLLTL